MKKDNEAIWQGRELVWAGDGKTFLRGVGEYFLTHPFFEEAHHRLLSEYKPKRHYRLGLFLPCAYGKPYSQSYIHYFIVRSLRVLGKMYEGIHQIILTNAGVVPRELEEFYPFCCYDWNPRHEDSSIKKRYSEVLCDRLLGYVSTFEGYYDKFACYLRHESDSYRAIRMIEERKGIRIPNLALLHIPNEEVGKVSLGIYSDEKDLPLIAPSNLHDLLMKVRRLLK